MRAKQQRRIFYVLFIILLLWQNISITAAALPLPSNHHLPTTENMGEDYLDTLYFFGESTTAHLTRIGGVFDNSRHRHQVLRDDSGTRTLDLRTSQSPVLLDGIRYSFAEAVRTITPPILVLSFGLNGLPHFLQDKNAYIKAYQALISTIQAASPKTKIILQSVYPVCNTANFAVDTDTLNQNISTINLWVEELAAATEGVWFADTASFLKDARGWLLPEYDNGDGIHLTNTAYQKILSYFATHALCVRYIK